jgi:hypothetical protein
MPGRPSMNDDFVDLLRALNETSTEFLIVGAHAMAVHGVPRATGDLDVLVKPDADNARRVLHALRQFGAPVEAHGVVAQDFERPGTVYQIGLPPRRIDLLTEISGITFAAAWSSRVSAQMGGQPVSVLGLQALITNKRASGRPKDLVDVSLLELKAGSEPG